MKEARSVVGAVLAPFLLVAGLVALEAPVDRVVARSLLASALFAGSLAAATASAGRDRTLELLEGIG